MDFFELQERARKNSGILVFLFGVAVAGLVLGTYFVLIFLATFGAEDSTSDIGYWEPELFLFTAVSILGIVGISSLVKTSSLKAGGYVVAESLGGVPISPDTQDFKQKQLYNIVEEMAIASGVPVPPVYILENERGINAFAAGYHPGDAVIGVTRGAMDTFDRDEMQAVVAHEFSHILNGDMKLNINLIGYLAGIFVISILGRILLRIGFYSGGGRDRNNAVAALGFIGLALLIMGYVGLLVGRIIKAAVSRQREYLADASSVQFTRNPAGIYNALKKIKDHTEGSVLENPKAEEASHMMFSLGIQNTFAGLFSTHPPLEKRLQSIERIAPSLLADIPQSSSGRGFRSELNSTKSGSATADNNQSESKDRSDQFFRRAVLAGGMVTRGGNPTSILSSAGVLDDNHIFYAREVIGQIPDSIKSSAREPYGARAVIYCLLIDSTNPSIREKQIEALRISADPGVFKLFEQLLPVIAKLPIRTRIPLIEIALPALSRLTQAQYQVFLSNMNSLIQADNRMDILEWSLLRILRHHLAEIFEGKKPPEETRGLDSQLCIDSASLVLSVLTDLTSDPADKERSLRNAVYNCGIPRVQYIPESGLERMDEALENLSALRPEDKRKFLSACETIILYDEMVNEKEAEVFRAIADSLNCPIPPVIPSMS